MHLMRALTVQDAMRGLAFGSVAGGSPCISSMKVHWLGSAQGGEGALGSPLFVDSLAITFRCISRLSRAMWLMWLISGAVLWWDPSVR